jgi:peptidoglycan/LPS O-acetylase OafA/YrhL
MPESVLSKSQLAGIGGKEIFSDTKRDAGRGKDIPLEALRGIAAIVVVLNHSILAFLPQYYGSGPLPAGGPQSLQGTLQYVFINGAGAVCLFFVLSGYVLTRRFCLTGETRILMKGVVKRWPRLMGPVLATVMLSYSLFYFHLYYFQPAGVKSASDWLSLFGDSFFRMLEPPLTTAAIHFRGALEQGLYFVFFRGDYLYDSSLWTMRPEFAGSLIAFGAAPFLLEARKSSSYLTIGFAAVLVALLHFADPNLEAFPIGVAMAVLLPRGGALPHVLAWPMLLAALYLLGYPGHAVGVYAAFGWLEAQGMKGTEPMVLGAALMIGAVECFPPARRVISGRFAALLGEFSFPIYLVHVLVIFSAGSAIYLRYGTMPAFAAVFLLTPVAALPLVWFNAWWVGRVNVCADALIRPRTPALRLEEPPAGQPGNAPNLRVSPKPS